MNQSRIQTDRILSKLDSYFAKNDYAGAERHLKYWLDESISTQDLRAKLLISNELIGLSRKVGKKDQTFEYTTLALQTLKELDIENTVSAATTYINVGTAHKAFDMAAESLPYFEQALDIYENQLPHTDSRLGGLYNNLALSLVDVKSFEDAHDYYKKALEVMSHAENGELEQAITHLNIASAYDAELGFLDGEEMIFKSLDRAAELLDVHAESNDGYYAFVCEKCASVFGYYGYFVYEKELKERSARIYERN